VQAAQVEKWSCETDVKLGGESTATFTHNNDGHATFEGVLSTKTPPGGKVKESGYALIRSPEPTVRPPPPPTTRTRTRNHNFPTYPLKRHHHMRVHHTCQLILASACMREGFFSCITPHLTHALTLCKISSRASHHISLTP
jgi:hypothetical protein